MFTLPKKRPGPPNLSCPLCWLALLAVVFLASFVGDLRAQTQLATVFGTVTDPSGAVIPGAQITIANQSTGLKRDTVTDAAGEYHLAGLPTGNYSLRLEKAGFQSQLREGVELTSAAEVMINSKLAIGNISQQTTVTANVAAMGGAGDAIFKDAVGNFAANAGQILTTAGTARQIQLVGRFTF